MATRSYVTLYRRTSRLSIRLYYCLICNKNGMLIPFNKFHFNCVEKEIIFLHELIIFIFLSTYLP